ncbi:MAG: hypothetical protein QOH35_4867 [Acidobacteriaceae bacterium]|jgi:hypothetical protein|nr:hypothetical protein [Acidobacteriaceae bacterium]MEA2543501.1 hypothetical protein [Acidobacteriaceae bacterium]
MKSLRGANTLFANERPLLIAEVHHQGGGGANYRVAD